MHNLQPAKSAPGDDLETLKQKLREWAGELGFDAIGITGADPGEHRDYLRRWLADGRHGGMDWMQRHAELRMQPRKLHAGVQRVICARMNYLHADASSPERLQQSPTKGHISRYATGRDYHKVLRKRLATLARRLEREAGGRHRAFVDSAPVLEKAFAEQAGIGWIGKHTNLLHREAGNWFFLGEIFTTLPLPVDQPAANHCGSCRRCIDICPTQAITAPWQLDARKCIAYLTIENPGGIPVEYRKAIGNHVFGCDDCLAICPWNKFARRSREIDFTPREDLDAPELIELFAWDEQTFLEKTEGTAIRRIGYPQWLRNIAVALGNAPASRAVIEALQARANHPEPLVREHVRWALAEHGQSP